MIIFEEMGLKLAAAKLNDPDLALGMTDPDAELLHCPPLVTVISRVVHSKTALLNKLSISKVAAGEAGSIVQHINAYHVKTPRVLLLF